MISAAQLSVPYLNCIFPCLFTVNIYGWKRVGTGKNRGGYFHPSFVQGIPELCLLLKRAPIPDTNSNSKKQETDDSASVPPPSVCLVEKLPFMSASNGLRQSADLNRTAFFFGMDPRQQQHQQQQQQQIFQGRNSLLGNMNMPIPSEVFQMQKDPNGFPSSYMDMMDPFGVRGLDSFNHSNSMSNRNRNTMPRTIATSGKMTEDMHLFADIFNHREFHDDLRLENRMPIVNTRDIFDDDMLARKNNISSSSRNINTGVSEPEAPGACENVFPQKLHFLLNQAEKGGFDHIISWVNDGAAFKVHDPKAFLEKVMPNYFDQSKFESFRRQLNLYGFQRVSRGPSRGIYYHQFFLQSEPSLCQSITRPAIGPAGSPAPSPGTAAIEC